MAFLSTEATAHTAGLHAHSVQGQADGLGHFVLDLGGVLGGAVDQHIAVLTGKGEGGLTLKVEVFLAADFQAA